MVEQGMITKALEEYHITDAALATLKQNYMSLKVKDVNDDEGCKLVHAARMDVKGKRVEVEKTRKHLKEDALEYGRAVDKEAKRITALLDPIEGYLERQEEIVTDEKARIKAEAAAVEAARVQARIDRLIVMGCIFNGSLYKLPYSPDYYVPQPIVATASDEQFEEICAKFQISVDAENTRIEKEKADKLAEEQRLASIRAEQEAKQKELDAQAEEQRKAAAEIKAAQDAIEKEKQRIELEEYNRKVAIAHKEELERVKKESAEKATKDAKVKQEKEDKDKADKIEKERLTAEKKAARAPDKEKLLALADMLDKIPFPDLKTKEGGMIARNFNGQFAAALKYLKDEAEAL